jgi:hypothetical protein
MSVRKKLWLSAVAALGLLPSWPSPSWAWVQTRNDEMNLPMAWRRSGVTLEVLTGASPAQVTGEQFRQTAVTAANTWNLPCTCVRLTVRGSIAASVFVEPEQPTRNNTVQFRTDVWARNAREPDLRVPYDTAALAITSVFSVVMTGEIVDADVEVNAVNYEWTDLVVNPGARPTNLNRPTNAVQDLQNTLTHEFGHVLGLDHNCTSPGQPDLRDQTGALAPSCSEARRLNTALAEATMFVSVEPRDTTRRDLALDDINGLCGIYPADGPVCAAPADDGGCRMAPAVAGGPERAATWPWLVVLAGGIAAALTRRRWRASPGGQNTRDFL